MIREFLTRHKKPVGVIAISSLLFIILGLFVALRDNSSIISQERLTALVEKGAIKRAVASSQYIYLYTDTEIFSVPRNDKTEDIVLKSVAIEHSFEFVPFLLFSVVSLAAFGVIWKVASSYLNKQKSYEVVKSDKKEREERREGQIYEIKSPIKFADIAGVDEAKEELSEIVEFLKNPRLFKEKNIHMPKGALLVGPPGVGKTLLARAVATEAGVPFFYKSAATFVELYVGVGAKRVSELFSAAKRKAPAIIFIDEIDAIGKSRGGSQSSERESTLNQLLVEMDGFESFSGITVIAATNKLDVLDEALLRPGRFDRRIFVELPDAKGREAILDIYLKQKSHSIDTRSLAAQTAGFSGALLANLINEAAINAYKRRASSIEPCDIEAVRHKVVYGKKRVFIPTEEETKAKCIYHAAKLLFAKTNGIEVVYASQNEIRVDENIDSKSGSYILSLIKTLLAGRAATKEILGEYFYFCEEDYKKANLLTKEVLLEYRLATIDSVVEIEKELQNFVIENREKISQIAKALKEEQKPYVF